MSFFFRPFIKIPYDMNKDKQYLVVTDILTRFKLRDILKRKGILYFTYTIKDSDRPDTVAERHYSDPTLDWLIFLTNDIYDAQFDWPLTYDNFHNYLKDKYTSVENSTQGIHHYEILIQEKAILFDDSAVDEIYLTVDETTYNATPAVNRRVISNYDYEVKVNESKRNIKLLQPIFVPQIINEVKKILGNG